ncbi:16S rRNA (guanine(966)-N(2))-methyltransferase RsmD [Methylocapsa aurea]|uniref:16S rRNA (guanine(966)-N(2))-methyltransferase RsmD n=1 Tax=Methylocapsa aurea TaxID=663610 RepID=UPI0005672F53|nr:16S rRNA (guanine(966)-N(2))-methyltransferase RsmD [Methylocapsa aurea]
MRIVGGSLRGRVLKGPAADAIRPTSDRLRETLFNILVHSYGDPIQGARVLDLFAGTGALALESLSRGATCATLVDQGAEAYALIRANVSALGLGDGARILRRDARKLGQAPEGERYNLAFLDPPYGRGLAPPALIALRDGGWLEKDALVLVEENAQADVPLPEGFALLETRRYGDTQVLFVRAM